MADLTGSRSRDFSEKAWYAMRPTMIRRIAMKAVANQILSHVGQRMILKYGRSITACDDRHSVQIVSLHIQATIRPSLSDVHGIDSYHSDDRAARIR